MIDSGIEAILVKVAALGLVPEKHLGKTIEEMRSHLHTMGDQVTIDNLIPKSVKM